MGVVSFLFLFFPRSTSHFPSLQSTPLHFGKRKNNYLFSFLFSFCPLNQVLRRSGEDEKILVIARKRVDHVCDTSLIVVNIVLWEGIGKDRADYLYNHLSTVLPQHGVPTSRRCGINET